jgi:hypothetical protein
MKLLYIVGPGSDGMGRGDGIYCLVADSGEGLASHMCSHAGYAEGDLEKNRPERQKDWKEKFGEYKIVWLGDDGMTMEVLKKKNEEWSKNNR